MAPLFLGGSAFGAIILNDGFDGTSLDSAVWTESGWYAPVFTVADSALTVSITGHSHNASLSSKQSDFNFFTNDLTLSMDLNPAATMVPAPPTLTDYENVSNFFGISKYSDWGGLKASNYQGLVINLTYNAGGLMLAGNITGYQSISAIPQSITVNMDATNYTISLVGATFDGGSSTLSGPHNLSEGDFGGSFYFLNCLTQQTAVPYANQIQIDSISITSSVPEPSSYAFVLGLTSCLLIVMRRRNRDL